MPGDTQLRRAGAGAGDAAAASRADAGSFGAAAAAAAAEEEARELREAEAIAAAEGFTLDQVQPRGALSAAASVLIYAQAGLIGRFKRLNAID